MTKATNYLNSSLHRIFKSDTGVFFANTAAGNKSYKPKAAFVKKGGSKKKVKTPSKVPMNIRPKAV